MIIYLHIYVQLSSFFIRKNPSGEKPLAPWLSALVCGEEAVHSEGAKEVGSWSSFKSLCVFHTFPSIHQDRWRLEFYLKSVERRPLPQNYNDWLHFISPSIVLFILLLHNKKYIKED